MYDFVYGYFFKYFEFRKDDDPRDAAIYGLMFVIFIHIFFLLVTFNYLTGTNFLGSAFGKNHSKYFWLILVVPIMLVIHRVYKTRSSDIITRYQEVKLLNIKT